MTVPDKTAWVVTADSGDPRLAIDDLYSTAWAFVADAGCCLRVDLGRSAVLAGLEIYWGKRWAECYGLEHSVDGDDWHHLCATRHGEGGQNVFAFPSVKARYLRLLWSEPVSKEAEIVELNIYGPQDAMRVLEPGRLQALGFDSVTVPPGEGITVDFGYMRAPLGVLVEWGETYGTVFSVHLSDDGESFREVGRILTGDGNYDSFYWRTTTARFLRFFVDEASDPAGAVIRELKIRILNKDRMPFGQLERAAQQARADLVPQTLLGKQVYWTVLGEIGGAAEALFDEYANLEPQMGYPQLSPLLRMEGVLHGIAGANHSSHTLVAGSLPIPTMRASLRSLVLEVTALANGGQAVLQYRVSNTAAEVQSGALVLAVRPVQVNPYWQHGGHAVVHSIAIDGAQLLVNGNPYATFSLAPHSCAVADFADGDIVTLIQDGALQTEPSIASGSGLISAACEFEFTLEPGRSFNLVASAPLRVDVDPTPCVDFAALREKVQEIWREKLGTRRIVVGDQEVADTVEAQAALILVNATRHAFKPGPRNYDRTWIRDGSSQALALLYAGLIDEAKAYVLWYAERIYPNGMVPPILNPDGSVNRGYGSDIEFDAQGEFVNIAAEVYRFSRDRAYLESIFEPVVRAVGFIEELRARTAVAHGPETRFYGLLAPSLSHEGYNKPSFSYWDNFFALCALRDCAFLATELGQSEIAERVTRQARDLGESIQRSMRMTTEHMGTGVLYGSADREDVDPTSTSIAFEPCRVADVLPAEWVGPTYDRYLEHLAAIRDPDFKGGFSPYEIRNLNGLVALGRLDDAAQLVSDALTWRRPPGWRHWAEVVWSDERAADYIGDMPHTWIGAEFSTAIRRMLIREDGSTLELFRAVPDNWWQGDGIALRNLPTTFGQANLRAEHNGSRVVISLELGGPLPERVTVRFPGVTRAEADGVPCRVEGDLVITPYARHWIIET